MKFVWEDGYCSSDPEVIQYEKEKGISVYKGFLYDDDGRKLEKITIRDYSTKGEIEQAEKNHWRRPYAYHVNYCCGFSMSEKFCEDPDAYHHYGWHGEKTMTINDVKRWCEEYIANLYIIDYDKELANLQERKARSDWFINNGYSGELQEPGKPEERDSEVDSR